MSSMDVIFNPKKAEPTKTGTPVEKQADCTDAAPATSVTHETAEEKLPPSPPPREWPSKVRRVLLTLSLGVGGFGAGVKYMTPAVQTAQAQAAKANLDILAVQMKANAKVEAANLFVSVASAQMQKCLDNIADINLARLGLKPRQ